MILLKIIIITRAKGVDAVIIIKNNELI